MLVLCVSRRSVTIFCRHADPHLYIHSGVEISWN